MGRPGGGDDAPEARVGEDVDPRKRRLPFALEDDDVLAAVTREAAEAVLEEERRWLRLGFRPPRIRGLVDRHVAQREWRLRLRAVELLLQGAAVAGEDRLGDRAQRGPLSASGIESPWRRNTPPGFPFQALHGPPSTSCVSCWFISSR